MASDADSTALSLDRRLQPHLAHNAGVDNPALAVNDDDVRVTIPPPPANARSSTAAGSAHPTWERFDDDEDEKNVASRTTDVTNSSHPTPAPTEVQTNGKTHASSSSPTTTTTTTGPPNVVYNCQSGEAVVVPGNVTSVVPGSGAVIATQHIPERWRELERPLRARQMKILKVLSVLAVFMFFPTGIPAVYYAWQTRKEFDQGILRGNIDLAQKLARRTERLIIMSAILMVLTAVLAFALVERAEHQYRVDHSYLAHASVHG